MILQKVISDIRFEIPEEVLEIAFMDDIGQSRYRTGSLDWEIRSKVIDAKVRPDCNLLGAAEVNIPLMGAEVSTNNVGQYLTTVRIPKRLTQGRTITEALYFNYVYNQGATSMLGGYLANDYNMSACGNSPIMNYATKILNASNPVGTTGTAAVRVIGENTILISDYMGSIKQGSLTCRVSFDNEMNNLPPRAVPQFTQLCLYAVQMYIYRKLKVKLNGGYLSGGSEMGEIANVVDSYADAATLYKEYFREEWTSVQFSTDPASHDRYLRNLIGGNL